MRSRIIWRTVIKVFKFFLLLLLCFALGVGSMLAGDYFFHDPHKGLGLSFFVAIIIFVIVFAYDQSKHEVERENSDLLRKIKK